MNDDLRYGGKRMMIEPINVPMHHVVDTLRGGGVIVVILEPGDGTRYRLLLTPCWASGVKGELEDVGILPGAAERYILVTKFDGHEGVAFFSYPGAGTWDMTCVENDWSRELLTWWLNLLWKDLV